MKIEFTKNEDGTLTVTSPEIRGYEWTLKRKEGIGTYATIAGKDEDADDEEISIEEWESPKYRKIWDSMSDSQAIESAHSEIMDII